MNIDFYLEADIDAEDLLKVKNRIKHKVLNKPEEGLISILRLETKDELEQEEIDSLILDLKVLDVFVDYIQVGP